MSASRRRARNPLMEFVKPGRRRTDHPLVVGTIVLCLGLTTVASIANVAMQYALSLRLTTDAAAEAKRADETSRVRTALVENMRSQSALLRRVCLNVARTDDDRKDCSPPPKGDPAN